MILSDKDKTLLIQCSAGIITNEELNLQIDHKLNFTEFHELLTEIYESEDQSLFEAVLWDMPNDLSEEELERLYSEFVLLKNHREHESIIRHFQLTFNQNPRNIQVLTNAMNQIPDYLSFDDFKYPYLRKIIYAIGAQPEPYNIATLEKLTEETNDEQIKMLLLHQIQKRSELGRWETARNDQ